MVPLNSPSSVPDVSLSPLLRVLPFLLNFLLIIVIIFIRSRWPKDLAPWRRPALDFKLGPTPDFRPDFKSFARAFPSVFKYAVNFTVWPTLYFLHSSRRTKISS